MLREKQGVTGVSSMLPRDEPFVPDFAKLFGTRICLNMRGFLCDKDKVDEKLLNENFLE